METESLTPLSDNNPKRKAGAPKGNKNAQKHGLRMLKRAVRLLTTRALDKRTSTVKALVQWREDLVRDLGGEVSTQQDAIIDVACKTKLILDSVDVWILEQPTLINKRKKSVIAAAKERQLFADALSRYMAMLGLARRTKLKACLRSCEGRHAGRAAAGRFSREKQHHRLCAWAKKPRDRAIRG